MDEFKFSVVDEYGNNRKLLRVERTFEPTYRARLACALIEKFGLIAADQDGEDSSGRQKGKLMKPEDVVARACSMADLAVSEFEHRGWLHPVPTLPDDTDG